MDCSSVLHRMHMCALAAASKELAARLAENPTVECENCGARAHAPVNLCRPRPFVPGGREDEPG